MLGRHPVSYCTSRSQLMQMLIEGIAEILIKADL